MKKAESFSPQTFGRCALAQEIDVALGNDVGGRLRVEKLGAILSKDARRESRGCWVRKGLEAMLREKVMEAGRNPQNCVIYKLERATPSPTSGPLEVGASTASSSLPTSGSSSPFRLGSDPDFSSSSAKEPWRDFRLLKKVVSVGRCPDTSVSGTPESLLPPAPPTVVVMASSSGTLAGPAQASTTPLCFPPVFNIRTPVRLFCRRRHSRSRAKRTMTTSRATSTGTSSMLFDSDFLGVLVLKLIEDWEVVDADVFMLDTGGPLVTLEVLRELVVMVTGGPLISLEGSRGLVAMVTGSPLVSLEGSRELVVMVTGGPVVSLEGSREPFAMVTRGPLVSVGGSRELVAMVTGGALVSLEGSRELVAVVTGSSLVTLEVSRESNVMFPFVTVGYPKELTATVTEGSLVALEISGSTDAFSVDTSWDVVGSGSEAPGLAPVEI